MQSKTHSLIEALLNVGSGFIVAMLVWQFIAAPIFGYQVSLAQNFGLTSIFTVVSVTRSYVWRRVFNHHTLKKMGLR